VNGQVIVVVPVLNEESTIGSVLEVLTAENLECPEMRIVVVDGGSVDRTCDLVRQWQKRAPNVTLLDNPQKLQGVGVNLAIDVSGLDGGVLVRCDAHSIYPERFVARLLETLDRTGADSVVVPMDTIGRACFQKAVAWISDTKIGSGGSAHRGGTESGFVDHGHHAAMRIDMFRRAGGYDPSFTHNEDAELDCRIRALGGTIFLDATIRIGYFPRNTPVALAKQYFNYGVGRSRTIRKHPSSLRLRQLLVPTNFLFLFASLIASSVMTAALLLPVFYISILALVSLLLSVRHRSGCGLLAGVAAFLMHNAWAVGFFWGLGSVRQKSWARSSRLGLTELPMR